MHPESIDYAQHLRLAKNEVLPAIGSSVAFARQFPFRVHAAALTDIASISTVADTT